MKDWILTLLAAATLAGTAQAGVTQEVRFKPGTSGTVIEERVIRGERDRYLLGASKGQYLTLRIESLEDNAVLDVYYPGAKETSETEITGMILPGAKETKSFTGQLAASGKFLIVVGGTRGNANYRLTVSVTNDPPEPVVTGNPQSATTQPSAYPGAAAPPPATSTATAIASEPEVSVASSGSTNPNGFYGSDDTAKPKNALPNFTKGESYTSVRLKMLAAGWKPLHVKTADSCHEGDMRCKDRPEMEACAGTGLANCKFLWTQGDETIAILTVGEDDARYDGVNIQPAPPPLQRYRYGSLVALEGILVSSTAEAATTYDEQPHQFPSLKLRDPIAAICTPEEADCQPETRVVLLHLLLKPSQSTQFDNMKGKSVNVRGTLFHSDNGHHFTPVLLDVESIVAAEPGNTQPARTSGTAATPPAQEFVGLLVAAVVGAALMGLAVLGFRLMRRSQSGKVPRRVNLASTAAPTAGSQATTANQVEAGDQARTASTPASPALSDAGGTSPRPSKSQVASQPAQQVSNSEFVNMISGLVSLAVVGFIGYQAWIWFFKPLLSGSTPGILSIADALKDAPSSELEKTTVLGKSTRSDVASFKDAGGLNFNPMWRGLHVVSSVWKYSGSGDTLSAYSLSVDGTARWLSGIKTWQRDKMSTQGLREALSGICGVAPDAWTFHDPDRSFASVKTQTLECSYGDQGDGTYMLTVAKRVP